MPFIKNIKIRMMPDDIRKKMHLPEKYAEDVNFTKTVDLALSLIHPGAVYELGDITSKKKSYIEVDGTRFTSRLLARNVRETERLFPFILTIGDSLEKKAAEENDILKQYLMENIGDMALRMAGMFVKELICRTHGISRLSSMSPGSLSDWPIEEQVKLFSLLKEGSGKLGVRLTESLLMLPRKSVSGVYFSKKKEFLSCRLCPRKNCSGRLAPYDEALKKSYRI